MFHSAILGLVIGGLITPMQLGATDKSGTISGETWTQSESPYHITGDIMVVDLTIQPGVYVYFDGSYVFEVAGVLKAVGSEAEPILFTRTNVAVYSSGDLNQTKILNGVSAVLGADVVAQETRPNVEKNEPELNIYHVVVQKLSVPVQDYHYLMHVAYTGETLFGHWRGADVLDDYIKVPQSKFGEFFSQTGIAPQVQAS